MEQERIWKLFARQLAGEISSEELAELSALLKTNPERSYALQIISAIWQHRAPEDSHASEEAFAIHLQRLQKDE